ncbi:esterase/lipase family protein [Luteimonas sp. A277]
MTRSGCRNKPALDGWRCTIIIAALLLASACSTLGVRDNASLGSRINLDGLELADRLADTTLEVVSMLDLREQCAPASEECASRILEVPGTVREATRLIAASDILYHAAKSGPVTGRGDHWRDCARHTHRYLHAADLPGRQGPITARTQLAMRLHNACTAGLVMAAVETDGPGALHWEVDETHFPRVAVSSIELARQVSMRGLRTRQVQDGIGVAAIARGRTRETIGSFPPQPFALAVNILYEPQADDSELLVVRDASRHASVASAFGPVALARDTSAAYATAAVEFEREIGFIRSLLGARPGREGSRIRLLAPVDPDKTPVILVHGFASSPMTWANMVNELLGDPDISEHYQFWMARYPTGLPVLVNRQRLAATLEDFRSRASELAGQRNPAVLVGHSMGGVISRLLVTRSGDTLWDAAFTVGPDEFDPGPPVERARGLFVFEPIPAVDELVMIAAPHGGSAMAHGFIAWIVQHLIRLPGETMDYLVELAVEQPDKVRPEVLASYRQGGPTSLVTLSPDQPVIRAARRLPIASGVTIHSIVGIQDPAKPETGDGVVSLESASWPTGSVDQVAAGHDLQTAPATISILKRILLERIGRSGQ